MMHSIILGILTVGLSTAPKTPAPAAAPKSDAKAQVQVLELSEAEKSQVLETIRGYLSSIGKKDEAAVKKYLSDVLQKAWGADTIKAIANDKARSAEDLKISLMDSTKTVDGRIFVKFESSQDKSKSKSHESHKPWYILKQDSNSKLWLIEDVTTEANPRSSMR